MKVTRQEKQISFQNQNRKNYFEGWYFKQASSDESVILSVIPSMMRSENKEGAMIQIILVETSNGETLTQTAKLEYLMVEFKSTQSPFSLEVGGNTFSKNKISLNIKTLSSSNDSELEIYGDILFDEFSVPPTSITSPTIMGIFSYFPFMECIHGIASLHHTLKGSLIINGKTISFDNGVGYIEKDWGQSFPKSYIWLQSNHFKHRPSCLFFSKAIIPLTIFQFSGFICHLWIDGQHYRFATYNLASCTVHHINENEVSITIRKAHLNLCIQASIETKGMLSAPKHGKMDHFIKEGLTGKVSFRFENKKTGVVIEDSSLVAGVEIESYFLCEK